MNHRDVLAEFTERPERYQHDLAFNGLYRGTCEDNNDPLVMRRIRVRVPEFYGPNPDAGITDLRGKVIGIPAGSLPWALPCVSPNLIDVPAVGEVVWVAFEKGDPERPVWLGIMWIAPKDLKEANLSPAERIEPTSEQDLGAPDVDYGKGEGGYRRRTLREPKVYGGAGDRSTIPLEYKAEDKVPNQYGFRFPRGTKVQIIETEDTEHILIEDIFGNFIQLRHPVGASGDGGDPIAPKYDGAGEIDISAVGKLNLFAGRGMGVVNVNGGMTINVVAGMDVNVTAGGVVSVTAPLILLNSGGGAGPEPQESPSPVPF